MLNSAHRGLTEGGLRHSTHFLKMRIIHVENYKASDIILQHSLPGCTIDQYVPEGNESGDAGTFSDPQELADIVSNYDAAILNLETIRRNHPLISYIEAIQQIFGSRRKT